MPFGDGELGARLAALRVALENRPTQGWCPHLCPSPMARRVTPGENHLVACRARLGGHPAVLPFYAGTGRPWCAGFAGGSGAAACVAGPIARGAWFDCSGANFAGL